MPSEITVEEFHNLPSPADLERGQNCGDDGQRECTLHNLHCKYPNCPKGKRERDRAEAIRFPDERTYAWDEFLDLSAQAGYNIKNTLANRTLFMSGYESGKEAMKSREVEALKRKLAQVQFENWENVGWEDKDNE